MKKNSIKSKIIIDCLTIMLPTIFLYIIGDLSASILEILTASQLGAFADNIFQLEISEIKNNLFIIVICICMSIVFVPIVNMFGETMLFKNSLSHDIKCLSIFLNKTTQSANALEEGEVQSRLEDTLIDLRCNLVDISEKTVIVPITIAIVGYNMFMINAVYALIIILVLPLRLVVPFLAKKHYAKFDMEQKEYRAKIREKEIEILKKPYIVKLLGIDSLMIDAIDSDYNRFLNKTEKNKIKFESIIDSINQFVGIIFNFIVLFAGAILVSNGYISPGSIAPMIIYFNIMNSCAEEISIIVKETKMYKNDLVLINELYNSQDNKDGLDIFAIESIECRNLCYDIEDISIIDNLSFTIRKGDKVAIVGENGSGKSTLLNILSGLLEDYRGDILINGKNIREYNSESLKRCFSYVTQDAFLFSCPIIENIKIGNTRSSKSDVIRIMKRLKMLYLKDKDTSFNSSDLSGGEKQRVSIARALLHNSNCILIDEGDNNLDKTSKRILAQYISNNNNTVIFVSHDKKMISKSNYIINIHKSEL